MKNRFSIGTMSKLHNVPIQTLRYYDKIGLFKPIVIDSNTGYRYYSTEQFEQLHTINYLKNLGIPLKSIKLQLETRDKEYFLNLLKKESEITERRIKELQLIKTRFENRIDEIEQAIRGHKLESATTKFFPERKILLLEEPIYSEVELELALRKLENTSNITSSIFIGKVGLTVSKNNIERMKFNEYNSIFILLEEPIKSELVTSLKAGKYACIYYSGDHSVSSKYYKMLLDYINKEEYKVIGDAVERTIINQFISKSKEDYLTEIQIPIG
ncbi:MerR family transcriptional regulator [Bacillus sp. T17B1]|uniref:MerR family transcriptional regulator n=1 Tax=Bacillus sp. T17B1 TaxID=2918911 RepID=UPI00227ED7E2|nr:MerR family transcriptional regulator [Bacillus sp. T17B1]